MPNPVIIGRFENQFIPEPNSGCWLWVAVANWKRYGTFNIAGKNRRAHRVAWELYRGQIPAGMQVNHKCNVRQCVNPDHLYLGTHADNMADMQQSGRRRGKTAGELAGLALLTEAIVRDIRMRRASGETVASLVRATGVSDGAVRHALSRRSWRHI